MIKGDDCIKSHDYVEGKQGWKIDLSGDAHGDHEFNDATVRCKIHPSISGENLTAGNIDTNKIKLHNL